MNIDIKALEKQFHADGFHLGMKAAEAGSSKEALFRSVQQLHQLVDEVVEAFSGFAEKHNQSVACQKGCHWCCHQPVFAQQYELELLNDFIQQKFNAETRKKIAARAAEKYEKLTKIKTGNRLHLTFPCPFLEIDTGLPGGQVCMVYPVRPVACRIYLSANIESCKKFFNEPDQTDAVPALLHFPMRMGRMINEGFIAALKASGMAARECRIEEFAGIAG